VGFDKIILRPKIVNDLQWVKTDYNSVRGNITSNWSKHGDNIMFEIRIPVNAQAELHLPIREGDQVFENGLMVRESAGVNIVSQNKKEHIYNLGSGKFNFEIKGKK
jgi:alpha-L-rhamnosidase